MDDFPLRNLYNMATPYQNILAGTAGVHPILQQIDQLNALYTTITPTATGTASSAESKENEELVKMQDDGVQEAVRYGVV